MINRIISTLKLEFIIQFRHGFIIAVFLVAFLWITLLKVLSLQNIQHFLSIILMMNLIITAYYFISGLMLLDKTSGVLEAIHITPLRSLEYLFCRVVALSALATVENILIVWLGIGIEALPPAAIISLFVLACQFSLWGYLSVIQFDDISRFLMPSTLYVLGFLLVCVPWFNTSYSWMIWLHPLGPNLSWLTFVIPDSLNHLHLSYTHTFIFGISVLLSIMWVIILFILAQRRHSHFIRR